MDPNIPVPDWSLSDLGRERAENFARRKLLPPSAQFFSSSERKAVELAQFLSSPSGSEFIAHPSMDENDRASAGYLPGPEFERHADQFFAQPAQSIAGWERAVDAQSRIVKAIRMAIAFSDPAATLVFCGHGGVGTLLKCALSDRPIDRREDQQHLGASGGGNCFVFDPVQWSLISDWTAMENLGADWSE